jgi:hypothetical protein
VERQRRSERRRERGGVRGGEEIERKGGEGRGKKEREREREREVEREREGECRIFVLSFLILSPMYLFPLICRFLDLRLKFLHRCRLQKRK